MLQRLTISNYALIQHLDLIPGEGLSIITGETGAGKSVMLGALSLLKGERADMKVIADKEKKAVVEAVFTALDENTAAKIREADPEWEGGEIIIRREIYPSGRSRAFLNDTPATLSQLEEISGGLLDIHSQNSNSLLSRQDMQLQLLDAIARNEEVLSHYTTEFKEYVTLRQTIRKFKEDAARNRDQAEYISFRLGQLDKLRPRAGELKKIETRYETLCNSEEVRNALVNAHNALGGGEASGAIELIDEAMTAVGNLDFSLWEENDPLVSERLQQCVIEIKDILESIEEGIGQMDYDPSSLASLSARMREYYAALRNFKVETDADLERLHIELKEQYRLTESADGDTEALELKAKAKAQILKKTASEITERRNQAALSLKSQIETEAKKLGLDNLRFDIRISDSKLSKSGGDNIEFLASFNKNGIPAPVGRIASGGEMARLMLVIKKISSNLLKLPTIIFDEIDTGVSGGIADKMGEMMKEMGGIMQILTITHLPQVAVKGNRHFKVYKEDRADRTVTDVMLLSDREREEEIGRMLAGETLSDAALTNARSLLGKNIDTN